MKNTTRLFKKSGATFALLALIAGSFGLASSFAHANTVAPNWNTTGSYVVDMQFNGTDNPHDMNLVQDGSGNLTGNGGSPAGANVYTWVITSGTVSGNAIDLTANYTATADAVTPQTVLNLTGTIASDGTISGTWSDNYQGGTRTGAFSTTSGNALALGTLSAQDFGVMNVSNVKGYTAGFGLTDATLAGATSVVTQLYSGTTLLQTDTAIIPQFNANITGTQFSSPFDVFGTFDYATDGYWTNVRGAEYGQTLIPTSVVATVTLANGKVVTAMNTNLTGDTSTIFPTVGVNNPTTMPAISVVSNDAAMVGKNGNSPATDSSFWVSKAPFVTTSTTLPAGVFSTAGLGPVAANTNFVASLSAVVGLPTITPGTKYYFAAWTEVNGVWYPGAVLTVTTDATTGTIGGDVTGGQDAGTLAVTSVAVVKSSAVADGTFANGLKYTFSITLPTNETHLSMKFADWMMTGGSGTIPVANNMRISSAQADNAGATVSLTAADTYSTPTLNMTTDLDPTTPGIQVQVSVEVAVPVSSINGSYTTSYGVKTI